MKYAAGEEVKKQLEALGVGTKIDLIGGSALIVTSMDARELVKASSIVNLLDSREKYAVRVIGDWTGKGALVDSDQVAAKAGNVVAGTFSQPPQSGIDNGVIVDVHNSKVVAIGPVRLLDGVERAFKNLTNPATVETAVKAVKKETPSKVAAKVVIAAREPVVANKPAVFAAPEVVADDGAGAEDFFQAELFDSLPNAKPEATRGQNEMAATESVVDESLAAKKQEVVEALRVLDARGARASQVANNSGKSAATKVAVAEPNQPATGAKERPKAEAKEKGEGEGSEGVDPEGDKALEMLKALVAAAGGAEPKTETEAEAETKAATEPKTDPAKQPGDFNVRLPKPPVSRGPSGKVATVDPNLAALKAENERLRKALEGRGASPVAGGGVIAGGAEVEAGAGEGAADAELEDEPGLVIPGGEEVVQTTVTPKKSGDDLTTLVLPEKVQILALIELVGKQLGLNYMFEPKLVTGEVSLKIHDGKIKVKDMYALLESVLKFKGFVMTRRGNLVTIGKTTDAAGMDPLLIKDAEDIKPGYVIVTRVFKLEHISTSTAQTMLQNMKLGISFIPIEDTKTLIVTGYAYRMARMEEILEMVDVKVEEKVFKSRKLEYLLPSVLAQKLQTLAQELGTISITVSKQATSTPARPATTSTRTTSAAARAAAARAAAARKPTPSKPTQKAGVFLDTDDRTNRILMIGLEEDIEAVNMLIDSLDVEKYGLKSIKEYSIQYVEATEVLDALSELGVIRSTQSSRSSTYSRTPLPTTRTSTTSRTTTARTSPTSYASSRTRQGAGDEPLIAVRLATNSLLVNATAEQHKEIEMVIKFVDVLQTDLRTVKEYEIQFVDATEVVDTLTELGIIVAPSSSSSRRTSSGTTSRTSTTASRTPTTAPAAPVTTFAATTGAEITSDQPQIAVLESTNSLLVFATPKQHETIGLVVAHVDRELTQISTPYVVYALENQDPDELAAVLNEIVQATVKEAAKAKDSKVQTVAPPSIRRKNEIQIVSDPKTYSLVVYADKKNQQWISALIEELDAYRPQVLLDVTLAEVNKTDDFTLDLQSAIKTAGGSTLSIVNPGSLLTTFPGGQINEASVISGAFQGFLADEHVQVLIDAIQKKSYGRILSRPMLLVDDNQEGTLDAKETTYVTRTSTITNPGSSSGTSTTSENVIFEAYDSGISLSIKPHISKGDNLRLEITLSKSGFTESITDLTKPPNTTTRDIVTVVTVPDSSTIILGGLEEIDQNKGGSKVPILGDIPLIGGLFRSTKNTDTQKKLYVFIKARIMRPGTDLTSQDLINISNRSRAEFESREDEMQLYEDWPGITPKPMEPLHILEEDDDYIYVDDETY